jgi:hypothetical protein
MFLNSWFRHRRGGQAHVFEGTGKHCADKACTLCAQSWAVKAMGSKTSIVFITWADEGRHSGRGDSFRKCRRYQISRTAFMVIPCCSARNDDVWSRGVCCSLVRKIAIASCASSVDTDLKPSCSIDTDMKALATAIPHFKTVCPLRLASYIICFIYGLFIYISYSCSSERRWFALCKGRSRNRFCSNAIPYHFTDIWYFSACKWW